MFDDTELKSLDKKNIQKKAGTEAQLNGSLFEYNLVEEFNKKEKIYEQIVDFVCQSDFFDKNKHTFFLCKNLQEKVLDFTGESKTTSKSDVILLITNIENNTQISRGFSVKMNCKNTQLHVGPFEKLLLFFEKNNFNFLNKKEEIISGFQKFLGINHKMPEIMLSSQDLISLQQNRISKKIKNSKNKIHPKFYSFELLQEELFAITGFLKENCHKLLTMGFKTGFCQESINHADYIIYNKCDYTKTKKIDIEIKNTDTYLKEITDLIINENLFESKAGNFCLGSFIGIQMKGSGDLSTYHNIQFKIKKIKGN